MPSIKAIQRRRLEDGIKAQIRHYQECLKFIPAVDSEMLSAGMELFDAEAALAVWLCSPARSLSGRIPIHEIRTVKGRKTVTNILKSLAHGVFL